MGIKHLITWQRTILSRYDSNDREFDADWHKLAMVSFPVLLGTLVCYNPDHRMKDWAIREVGLLFQV